MKGAVIMTPGEHTEAVIKGIDDAFVELGIELPGTSPVSAEDSAEEFTEEYVVPTASSTDPVQLSQAEQAALKSQRAAEFEGRLGDLGISLDSHTEIPRAGLDSRHVPHAVSDQAQRFLDGITDSSVIGGTALKINERRRHTLDV